MTLADHGIENVNLFGPKNTKHFIASTRHFVARFES